MSYSSISRSMRPCSSHHVSNSADVAANEAGGSGSLALISGKAERNWGDFRFARSGRRRAGERSVLHVCACLLGPLSQEPPDSPESSRRSKPSSRRICKGGQRDLSSRSTTRDSRRGGKAYVVSSRTSSPARPCELSELAALAARGVDGGATLAIVGRLCLVPFEDCQGDEIANWSQAASI